MERMGSFKDKEQQFITKLLVSFLVVFFLFPSSISAQTKYEYTYTGSYQEFEVPKNGVYKIQLWGAQGGNYNSSLFGGLGGYTEGTIKLLKGEKLYVYVGQQPSSDAANYKGGWNGGGNVPTTKDTDGRAGGGATDIRTIKTTVNTEWNETSSLASRIMVAAGGGGSAYEGGSWWSDGGPAGGLTGFGPQSMGSPSSVRYGTGGSQTAGGFPSNEPNEATGIGAFGRGGNGYWNDGGAGGGSGWFGGGASSQCSGAGGGSSYISGHEGCIAVDENGKTIEDADTDALRSRSWTGKVFEDTKIIDGKGYLWTMEQEAYEGQPNHDNTDIQVGNSGHGYAIIEFIADISDDNTLKGITSNIGELTPTFDASTYEYDLMLEKNQRTVEILAEANDKGAVVNGNGSYSVDYRKENKIDITVTSESGLVQVYQINLKRKELGNGEHSSLLADLNLGKVGDSVTALNPAFRDDVKNYNVHISYSALELPIEAIPYDEEATVKIEGNDLIINPTGTITITVSEPHSSDTVYTITYDKGQNPDGEYAFDYTGDYQEFIAPSYGKYQIELWGSQGSASSSLQGGKGAYTKGTIVLDQGEKLYIYVGDSKQQSASFNGGGKSGGYAGGGGGATDIRLTPGVWNDFNSLKSRIMVAAGGGGATSYGAHGGAAGGIYSYDVPYYYRGGWSYTLNTGAEQTSGGKGMVGSYESGGDGSFGIAGRGGSDSRNTHGGAGGSGYYGGGGGGDGGPMVSSGSGGSSYISGHIGCNSITETSTETSIVHTGETKHYSGKYFTDTKMIDGLGYSWVSKKGPSYTHSPGVGYGNHVVLTNGLYTGQPTIDGTDIQEGKEGNGYAKITPLFQSQNNYLESITASNGNLSPSFSSTTYEYDLILEKEERFVELSAKALDEKATVEGLGRYKVKYGEVVEVPISVTSENGEVRVYQVNISREKLKAGEHSSKIADLDFVVEEDEKEPVLKPDFTSNTLEYQVNISASMAVIDFDCVLFDEEATIKKEGTGIVISDSGTVTLTVSEPNSSDTVYIIHWKRGENPLDEYTYVATGNYQTFIAPSFGEYQIELWGSQGSASGSLQGGKGAYTKGTILLDQGEKLYLYVGNSEPQDYSFNGGGTTGIYSAGGGGATDVRLVSGPWNDFNSLKSRIMVAAGGGGASSYGSHGGAAGGIYSYDVPYYAKGGWSYTLNTGAQQTSGGKGMVGSYASGSDGSFGIAGSGSINRNTHGAGGGSGYYGGSGGGDGGPMVSSGSGGSSYISGHTGSDSITESSTETSIVHTGKTTHYSGKVFTNTKMIDGLGYEWVDENGPTYTNSPGYGNHVVLDNGLYTGQPTTDGTGIQEGQEGDGYARITPLFQSKNNYLADLTTNYGKFEEEFDPFVQNYTLTLDKYEQHFTLKGTTADKDAIVTGLGKYKIGLGETKVIDIQVTAPNGEIRTYQVTATRGDFAPGEHSTKLEELNINQGKYILDPEFISIETNYELKAPYSAIAIDVEAIPYDEEATVKIEGNGYLKDGKNNIIKVTVTHPGMEDTVYEMKVSREENIEGQKKTYECTNGYQEFIAPASTYYRVQLWGAGGGYGRTNWSLSYRGGQGAYTEGEVYLVRGQKIYVYVGCAGKDASSESRFVGGLGGFNGGGKGGDDTNRDSAPEPGGGGGGATDIRLVPTTRVTEWNEFASLKSRIMVAAGGGGGNYGGFGGSGGTLEGLPGYGTVTIPTQTNGYAFGAGEVGAGGSDGAGGGGGGYFGGYSTRAGSGGSSFVSGCENCISILNNSAEGNIISSSDGNHYSGYIFDKIQMISGDEVQPSTNGGYQTGNTGDGHAIITAAKNRSENNFLASLTVDKGTLTPEYEILTRDYEVNLTPEDDTITIDAVLDDETATLSGTGEFDVPAGTTTFPITVTAENGDIRIYHVTTSREKSSNSMPLNIKIGGLVPSLCNANQAYCQLAPGFNPDTDSYSITVPGRLDRIDLQVEKGHKYQTVIGDGVVTLEPGVNNFTIEVISEDEDHISTYHFSINRDMSGNTNLNKLEVIDPAVNIDFEPTTLEYYFSIPNAYTKVELDIELQDENASYEVLGNENFEVGLNVVRIIVTAANNDQKTYALNIYREQNGNTFLSDITVKHDDILYPLVPIFNKTLTNYVVNVENEVDKIVLAATPEHTLTTVTGTGEKTLVAGVNKFELTATSEDGSVQIYTVTIIRKKSSDATLKSLDVLEGTLSPEFKSEDEIYNITVSPEIDHLTLNPVLSSSLAKYRVTGNSGFTVGKNVVYITVTAEDGTKKTYVLNVTKKASNNNYLSSLTLDKYNLSTVFNKETETYEITVDKTVKQIKVSATPEHSKAKVSNTGLYNLKAGENTINVVVTAEDGSKKTYTLKITVPLNTNSSLASLTTSSTHNYTPTFRKDVTSYTLEVDHDEDKLTVLGVSEDPTATVTGNGTYHLNIGENKISIKVEAENKDQTLYELTVVRKASDNANISLLIARESVLDPAFDKETTSYDLRVLEEVTELTLYVNLEDKNATYEVLDNENFQIGNNTVRIRVTAEDGTTTKDYTLNVLRQKKGETSNYLNNLTVSEGTLDPTFDKEKTYYEVEVPYETDQIQLDGELDDKNATVEGFENYPLTVGQNVLAVKVTSTENVVRYYQVVVTRKGKTEARLQKLEVLNHVFAPDFDKDTENYQLTTYDSNLVIEAETLDNDATYEIIGAENLQFGSNEVIVRVTAEDGETVKDYVITVQKEKSKNNNLKSLEVSGATFTPDFDKSTTVYQAVVDHDVNSLQITALPEDSKATVSGDGEVILDMGINYIDITVTSESGSKKVYTLVVTREAGVSNYLTSLITSEGTLSPAFDKTENNYTVHVPYEVEELTVSGTLEDINASVVGFDKYSLQVGDNEIKVTVTAENGNVNVYTVVVTRENIVSSLLESLTMEHYQLEQTFDKEIFDYTVTVDYEVTDLALHIKTLDKNATYIVNGNSNFNVGMNTVEIVVTDSLGKDTSTYTLNVNRQNYANTFLSYIYTTKGTLQPDFSKEWLSYTVEVDSDVDKVEVLVSPEVLENTLTGEGEYTLNPGSNLVTLTVTTNMGISRKYYLDIIRKQDDSNDLTSLKVNANGERQTLTPDFDKDTLEYSVTVSPSTPSIEILATASNKASISGIGTRPLSAGDNIFNITVTSESGATKVYKITVHREASDNNYLATLVPSVGTLDPEFHEKRVEYTLLLDSSVSTLSFTATTKDQFATVTGNEIQVIPDGESLREIVVKAENGDEKTYKVKVIKERGDEARLSDLKIPNYPFEETFDKDTFNYTVTLPQGKSELTKDDVIATALDSKATIDKMEKLTLSSTQDNIYVVEVTARDGFTKQTYTIKVNLVSDIDITKIILDDEVALGVGEEFELQPTFEPVDATNKEIEYVSNNPDIATVENGKITGVKEGETTIVVSSKKDPTIKKEVKVKVINLKISSQVYEVRRDEVNLFDANEIKDIIIGAAKGESLTDFIGKLDNDASLLKVYDRQNQEITDLDNNVVTTGYKVTLEFNNKRYDSVYVVVRGDNTQDGAIDADDNALLKSQILSKVKYDTDTLVFKATDVVETQVIDADDMAKLNRYILGKEKSLN